MIVTCTPNPSFDRTIEIDRLEPGAVHRARSSTNEAGGKGINVSRALARAGIPSTAVFPAGSSDAAAFGELLAEHAETLHLDAVGIAGSIRINVTVRDEDGTTTKLNELGPVLSERDVAALLAAAKRPLGEQPADHWFVGSGSLPRGCGDDLYRRFVDDLRAQGVRTAIDTSGAALRAVADAAPDLLKPNENELAELVGRPLPTLGHAVDAAAELLARGVGQVLVSLGPHGALLVSDDGTLHARSAVASVRNTVGAGDATLAGFLAAGGVGELALANAVAWGAAAVESATTAFVPPAAGESNVVTGPPDRSLRLSGE